MNQGIDIIKIFSDIKQNDSVNSKSAFGKPSYPISIGSSLNKGEKIPINVYRLLIARGFYHFIEYLLKLANQSHIDYSLFNHISLLMESQNLSILKVFSNLPNDEILYSAIQSDCFTIINYAWANLQYYNQLIYIGFIFYWPLIIHQIFLH